MKQTVAPKSTPSPREKEASPPTPAPHTQSAKTVFISMALDMSWRLALVVLVPIIGGFKLDEALDMTPLLTIVGFLIAMVGMGLVMWRTLQVASSIPVQKRSKK